MVIACLGNEDQIGDKTGEGQHVLLLVDHDNGQQLHKEDQHETSRPGNRLGGSGTSKKSNLRYR